MKNVIFALFLTTFSACSPPGTTEVKLTGKEPGLPPELKGLVVHRVSLGNGDVIKVAYLPNAQTVTSSYLEGKIVETVVLIQANGSSTVIHGEIIGNSDGIIVIRETQKD